jgi:PRTRC genetic system protein B
MNTMILASGSRMHLSGAILLYSDGGAIGHASLHKVADGVVDSAAKPLSLKALRDLSHNLARGITQTPVKAACAAIWPSTILYLDKQEEKALWYLPQANTLQVFEDDELGRRKENLNMPTLVFYQSGTSLSVCAIQGTQRPEGDTPVYHAPLFNVYENGVICLGQVKLKRPCTADDVFSNQAEYLIGINTHPNGRHCKTTFPTGIHGLWNHLLANPTTPWDDQWLSPADCTLSQWIEELN